MGTSALMKSINNSEIYLTDNVPGVEGNETVNKHGGFQVLGCLFLTYCGVVTLLVR